MQLIDLRIALWNADGIISHKADICFFVQYYKIDLLLISETHLTEKSHFHIDGYSLRHTVHPSGKARGGSGILIKNGIKFEEWDSLVSPAIQLTAIQLTCGRDLITVGAAYCPPRESISHVEFEQIIDHMGSSFILGGDYNAKHRWWGSRTDNPKGKELYRCISRRNVNVLSTGTPTFYSKNPHVTPDLLDFFVYKGISADRLGVSELGELLSDHLAVMCLLKAHSCKVSRTFTNYHRFEQVFNDTLSPRVRLSNPDDVETAAVYLNETSEWALKESTRVITTRHDFTVSLRIRQLIERRRQLRRVWLATRYPSDKANFNRSCKSLKLALQRQRDKVSHDHLNSLGPTAKDDYSLWKTMRYVKSPQRTYPAISTPGGGAWLRTNEEKASAFSAHLSNTFVPHNTPVDANWIEHVENAISSHPTSGRLRRVLHTEVVDEIVKINVHKSPGPDRINGRMIKRFHFDAVLFMTRLFNAILKFGYFPAIWKRAEIIMIVKPGKPPNQIASYRPISLLSMVSKIFERIILRRLNDHLTGIIPDHQFGFRRGHGTIQQCHRVVNIIHETLEEQKYCVAALLDFQSAFDRVWIEGLLYKIRDRLPAFFAILKSFLSLRSFAVRFGDARSASSPIRAGVPQGSVLGPVLYSIYTADMPSPPNVNLATYADDTIFLVTDECPVDAATTLQSALASFKTWCDRWRIMVNAQKSMQVTFTNCLEGTPPVMFGATLLPRSESVIYLGMHLDRRLTWAKHIATKKKQIKIVLRRHDWLLRPTSGLNLASRIMIYKSIIMPIWTYGIELWGVASKSNIAKMESSQCQALRSICNAPWYVRNDVLRRDLQVVKVSDYITTRSRRYLNRLIGHNNHLIADLPDAMIQRRLRRHHVTDLPSRIL